MSDETPSQLADRLVDNVACATQLDPPPNAEDWRRNAESLFRLALGERERSGPFTSTAINSTGRTYTSDEVRECMKALGKRSGAPAEGAREWAERICTALSFPYRSSLPGFPVLSEVLAREVAPLFAEIVRLKGIVVATEELWRKKGTAADDVWQTLADTENRLTEQVHEQRRRAESAESALREAKESRKRMLDLHAEAFKINAELRQQVATLTAERDDARKLAEERAALLTTECKLASRYMAERDDYRQEAIARKLELEAQRDTAIRLMNQLDEARAKLREAESRVVYRPCPDCEKNTKALEAERAHADAAEAKLREAGIKP